MTNIEPIEPFKPIGEAAKRVVSRAEKGRIINWDGKKITKAGRYSGISLADYHEKIDLFDGFAVSKSPLKHLLPTHGGSPKAFYGRWLYNQSRVEPKSSKFMDFGRATHCLLLGDQKFSEHFSIRPEEAPDGREWNAKNKSCKGWVSDQGGKTIITHNQLDTIRRIAEDASSYPLIQQGILNGDIEHTLVSRDAETGLFLKARPDALPVDGIFADLKTASSFSEDFLERQIFNAGYYLQAALTRMVCRDLGIPFDTFVLVYVLNDDVPDTTHVEISEEDINRGEKEIIWALRKIKQCLDTGEWPGALPFQAGGWPIRLKQWDSSKIDRFLEMEDAA